MANYYKVLGQQTLGAGTPGDLYPVPAGRQAVISTITVANRGTTSATYRIWVRVAAASLTDKQYIAYDATVLPNDAIALTLGITLAATDVVSVQASTANVSFNAFGTEIY